MITWTGTELLKQARFANGSLGEGITMDAGEVADDLITLNMLLASWDILLYGHTQETKALTPGTASYTWGAGGVIATARPVDFLDRTFIRESDTDYVVEAITKEQYDQIGIKSTTGRPDRVCFDPQYPLAVLYFYPSPDSSYTVYLTSIKGQTEITDATQTLVMPQDLVSALKWALAIELAPNYNVPVTQVMALRATETKQVIVDRAFKYGLQPVSMDNVSGRNRRSRSGTILSY